MIHHIFGLYFRKFGSFEELYDYVEEHIIGIEGVGL